jgi:two-component system response regulator YesN
MYNLLIVDDEIEILEWLKELFMYECPLEIEVYTANSGKQAINILNDVKFDVVLTDIKMPGMNGLELYHHIKENWMKAQVIFLTGYQEHETLYEIVKNKGVRYLLKTEGDDVIVQAVTDALQEMEQLLLVSVIQEEKAMLLEKALYWLQKEYLEKLMTGMQKDQITQKQLNDLKISLKCNYPVLVYLGKIEFIEDNEREIYQKQEEILYCITNNMPKIVNIYTCVQEQSYVLMLIQPKITDEFIDWGRVFHISSGALEDIQTICKRLLQTKLSFAISNHQIKLTQLGEQYYQLKTRLITILKEEDPVIINYDNIEEASIQVVDGKIAISKIPMLSLYLEQRNKEEFQELLQELTCPLLLLESRNDLGALELYYNIAMVFLKYINLNKLNDKLPFYIGMYKLVKVDEHNSWIEAVQYFKDLSNIIFEIMGDVDNYRKDMVMQRVEDYIHNNLGNDLTLTKLAEVGGFNASYLSRIFKQKYHCNVSEYIVQERMQCAKRLLIETNKKVNKIGEEVGYSLPHSFTRIFKKSEGITPVEYRELYWKNNKKYT